MANRPTEIPVQHVEASSKVEPFISRIVPDPAPAGTDPDHHLWRNGRLWWIAFTVHRGHLQERVRFSLGTDDVAEARRKRDLVRRQVFSDSWTVFLREDSGSRLRLSRVE